MDLSSLLVCLQRPLKQEMFGIATPSFRMSYKEWLLGSVLLQTDVVQSATLHLHILYLFSSWAMPDTPLYFFLPDWVDKKVELSPSIL